MKRAFITGCASGFGHRLARALLERQVEVVASDINVDRLIESFDDHTENEHLRLLHGDVRDAQQVRRAIQNIGN